DSSGVRVFLLANLAPPGGDGRYREHGCVVINSDGYPCAVVGNVVDAVGYCFAIRFRKVVGGNLVRVQLDVAGSGGGPGPVVNSWTSTSSRSTPCLVAVDR